MFHVLLYKEGLLSALGHDHVIEVSDSRSELALGTSSASARIVIATQSLEIDSPPARLSEGLSDKLSDKDRAKIKDSMRGRKGLDAARYPEIVFVSNSIEPVVGEASLWMVSGDLSLHGSTRTLEFAVATTADPQGSWFAGSVRIRPSDFGIAPISVAGGLVRVRDEALVRFRLRAHP